MSKFLLLIFVVVAAWWLIRRLRGKNTSGDAPGAAPEQRMVICSHCGLYLPQSEAIPAGDKFYCCAEHRSRAD